MIAELIPVEEKENRTLRLVRLFTPGLQSARRRLGKLGCFGECMYRALLKEVVSLADRTLAWELHLARHVDELKGATPEERFDDFVRQIGSPDRAREILSKFPVLDRVIRATIEDGVRFAEEAAGHLQQDSPRLERRLGSRPALDDVVGIDLPGDRHRRGRSVLILHLSTGARIVYKPRSMANEKGVQGLLDWLNRKGFTPGFRPYWVEDSGSHGWMEFVEAGRCSTKEQLRRYHERFGGMTALLHLLSATDLHWENVIAAGEHPVPVDLEALFHPDHPADIWGDADSAVNEFVQASVLNSGLLPFRTPAPPGQATVDFSVLTGQADQKTGQQARVWDGEGTDQMRIVFKAVVLPGSQNLPGEAEGAWVHRRELEAGFDRAYRIMMGSRCELQAKLEKLRGSEVRVLLRSTEIYAMVLSQANHPELLRAEADQVRHIDIVQKQPTLWPHKEKIVECERNDLLRRDVPIFTTRNDSRDLWNSEGERMTDFFPHTGLDQVLRRFRNFGEKDLEVQKRLLRESVASSNLSLKGPEEAGRVRKPALPVCSADPLAEARKVGDHLGEIAIRGRHGAAWLGLQVIGEKEWSILPAGLDLYDGQPGIALFLAYLGHVTGESRYSDLARAAARTISDRLHQEEELPDTIGAFSGWGGLVYLFARLERLWPDVTFHDETATARKKIEEWVREDDQLDLIGGAAGAIGALVAAGNGSGLVERCAERLLETMSDKGWRPATGARALTGFSHGAAGYAWALLRAWGVTGREEFREAAIMALEYERRLFNPTLGNWPDLRKEDDVHLSLWCHGAPGIAMARISSLPWMDDGTVREEIRHALRTTMRDGFGNGHGLCHGDLGNLDALLLARRAGIPVGSIESVAGEVLHDIRESGWRTDMPQDTPSLGLMTGLAGIGYGLLRLAAPETVPSVLTLA